MTDLVVIHPGAAHGIFGSDLAKSLVAVEPPLWPRLIAGAVRDAGFTVQIIDAEVDNLSPEMVAGMVDKINPRLVAIAVFGHQPSASTQQMIGASATAKAIKDRNHLQKVMMLGGHISALPERTLTEERVDYVCVGEGPATIIGLLGKTWECDVPGLVYWDEKNDIKHNERAPLLDVDKDLHGQAWDLLPPLSRYRAHNWHCFGGWPRSPYAAIYTSLGCSFKCSFCMINAPFGTNRYRMRSPENVIAEMVRLHKYQGVRSFKIVDEMFILNERHYTAIAQGLIDAGIGDDINIWAYSRVDTVKSGHLPLLRRAGFRWLALGIESASKYVRDGSRKNLKNNDIVDVVRSIQAHDINVIGNYIFGLPDDDHASMKATLDLALVLNCEFANFYSAMAYPGSPLYVEAVDKGWTLPASWRGYSQHNDDCRPLDTLHISGADVLRFRDEAFVSYFESPKYLTMVDRKFGPETVEHVRGMTTFKLKRKLLAGEIA